MIQAAISFGDLHPKILRG